MKRIYSCIFAIAIAFYSVSALAATLVVTNTNSSGAGSLANAISTAASGDIIHFNITTGGTYKQIVITNELTVTKPLTIDATSQTGYSGEPLVIIVGSGDTTTTGFHFLGAASGSTLKGVRLINFSNRALLLDPSLKNFNLSYNYIGLDSTNTAVPNNFGIQATNISGCTFSNNVISGNKFSGIQFYGSNNNTITQNIIGLDPKAKTAIPNAQFGIQLTKSSMNTIGGVTPNYANIISGNSFAGIQIGLNSDSNTVANNNIGNSTIGNGQTGIQIDNSTHNYLNSNSIIGNGQMGVQIGNNTSAAYNMLVDNIISMNNIHGVQVVNSKTNTINNNAISENKLSGIEFVNAADSNSVSKNTISNNLQNGISITSATKNTISQNQVYGNVNQGITLNNGTANDSLVSPKLDLSSKDNKIIGVTNIKLANATIELFIADTVLDCTTNPEGKVYIGSTVADGTGAWNYIPGSKIVGKVVTTATLNNSTSRFSVCSSLILGVATVNATETSIFPNPTSDFLTITISKGNSSYVIFDQTGNTVGSGLLQDTVNSVNVSGFANGIYTISILNADSVIQNKFVVIK